MNSINIKPLFNNYTLFNINYSVCARTSKGEHVRSAAPTAVERQCSQQTPRAVQYINPACSNTVLSLNLDLKPTSQLCPRSQETG